MDGNFGSDFIQVAVPKAETGNPHHYNSPRLTLELLSSSLIKQSFILCSLFVPAHMLKEFYDIERKRFDFKGFSQSVETHSRCGAGSDV